MSHDVQEYKRGHKDGLKAAVTWLHDRAKRMNDPKATEILNVAAHDLGNEKHAIHKWDAPQAEVASR